MNERVAEVLVGIGNAVEWWKRRTFDQWKTIGFRTKLTQEHIYGMPPEISNYSVIETHRIVCDVVATRARLLGSSTNKVVGLGGGKLLRHEVNWTTCTLEAKNATMGFFDDFDVPSEDTWVAVVGPPGSEWREREQCIISWVPPELVKDVNMAIRKSFEENICWLFESSSVLANELTKYL